MSWTLIIVLIAIGLLFLVLEMLVIPGFGVAGIIGAGLIIIAVWQAYQVHGAIAGHYTVAGTVVFSLIVIYLSLKSGTWNKMMLKDNVDGKVNLIDEEKVKTGDRGIAISRLSPAGKAHIGDTLYEVHCRDGFLDEGSEIEIIRIERRKIIVKQIKS